MRLITSSSSCLLKSFNLKIATRKKLSSFIDGDNLTDSLRRHAANLAFILSSKLIWRYRSIVEIDARQRIEMRNK